MNYETQPLQATSTLKNDKDVSQRGVQTGLRTEEETDIETIKKEPQTQPNTISPEVPLSQPQQWHFSYNKEWINSELKALESFQINIDPRSYLEVVDKKKRYGKNLRVYYKAFLESGEGEGEGDGIKRGDEREESNIKGRNNGDGSCDGGSRSKYGKDSCGSDERYSDFFAWLDHTGHPPELSSCPRSLLLAETVFYCSTYQQTESYRVNISPSGLLIRECDGTPLTTTERHVTQLPPASACCRQKKILCPSSNEFQDDVRICTDREIEKYTTTATRIGSGIESGLQSESKSLDKQAGIDPTTALPPPLLERNRKRLASFKGVTVEDTAPLARTVSIGVSSSSDRERERVSDDNYFSTFHEDDSDSGDNSDSDSDSDSDRESEGGSGCCNESDGELGDGRVSSSSCLSHTVLQNFETLEMFQGIPPYSVEGEPDLWLFVLRGGCFYCHPKVTKTFPRFHHSSFFGGGAVDAAGMFSVKAGQLKQLHLHSGHYRPGEVHLYRLLLLLAGRTETETGEGEGLQSVPLNLAEVMVDAQRVTHIARLVGPDGLKLKKLLSLTLWPGDVMLDFLACKKKLWCSGVCRQLHQLRWRGRKYSGVVPAFTNGSPMRVPDRQVGVDAKVMSPLTFGTCYRVGVKK